jgi:hypothetical protein
MMASSFVEAFKCLDRPASSFLEGSKMICLGQKPEVLKPPPNDLEA